jgi:hypothetical protein
MKYENDDWDGDDYEDDDFLDGYEFGVIVSKGNDYAVRVIAVGKREEDNPQRFVELVRAVLDDTFKRPNDVCRG